MHTTKYEEDTTNEFNVKTRKIVVFHHNDDYSGDVIINVSERLSGPTEDDYNQLGTVQLPFQALLEFVAEYVRDKWIEKYEEADVEYVLDIPSTSEDEVGIDLFTRPSLGRAYGGCRTGRVSGAEPSYDSFEEIQRKLMAEAIEKQQKTEREPSLEEDGE